MLHGEATHKKGHYSKKAAPDPERARLGRDSVAGSRKREEPRSPWAGRLPARGRSHLPL